MEVIIYSVPSWIIGVDNKPSKQVFEACLAQCDKSSIVGMTVEQPDLFTINIQTTGAFDLSSFGNLISFKGLYYAVTNMSIVTDDNTVIITGKIDVYLSFMVSLFDESTPLNPSENLVFFKQKHLNRYSFNGSNQSILYEQQRYLTNIPNNIKIKQKIKNLVYANFNNVGGVEGNNVTTGEGMYVDFSYSQRKYSVFNDCIGLGFHNQGYDYLLVKESPQEQSQSGGYGYNLYYGFWQYIENGRGGSNTYYNTDNGGVSENMVSWWLILLSISSDYYIDMVRLPAPIQSGMKNEGLCLPIRLYQTSFPTSYLDNYSPGMWEALNKDDGFQKNSVLIWKNWGANLYYSCIANFSQWDIQDSQELATTFQAVNDEPALLNFVECRAHLGGEDCQIDLTAFNYPNEMDLNQFSYLFSFCMSLNYPFTQITNIPYDDFLKMNDVTTDSISWMYPWNYTKTNDAIYCLNLKYTLRTQSSNWQNFLANNLNSYHTSLNVSHYMVQESQARLVQSGINSSEAVMRTINPIAELGGFFTGNNPALQAASAIEGTKEASEALKAQQLQYNYLASGKEQDMSRVANERNATNGNAFALYNTTLTWIFEYPTPQDMNFVINYFMMNGYEINRWIGFSSWNNRKLWNYVSIAFFSDVLLPQLTNTYKSKVDDIANKGFRVIKQAFFADGTITALNTFGNYLINNFNSVGYSNSEVNNNNDELNYLIGQGY